MALAPAEGAPHTPVQVQKILFLLDRNASASLGGAKFNFQPYHYGPFDRAVYRTLEDLAQKGQVEITQNIGNWRDYRLTLEGQAHAGQALSRLDERTRSYILRISEFVRSLSFTDLVSAIYKAYPEMRERSVFQG